METVQHQQTVLNHFNFLAGSYDEKAEKRKNYLDAIDALIINNLKKQEQAPLLLLDVGCGTGTRAVGIANALDATIWGIDVAEEMIKQAEKKIDKVYEQSMTSLQLPQQFDAIFCLFNAFGYLGTYKERLQALRNMQLHLHENGTLFIDVMNILHKGEGRAFERKNREIIKDIVFPIIKPNIGLGNKGFSIIVNNKKIQGFVHGFFDLEMKWLLKRSGFEIVEKQIIGYDSGEIKKNNTEGQLFYVCKKKNE